MPYHLDMGNQTSQPPGEGTYKIILDANGNIKNIPGAPGVDYESADHVLHLDVHNWREGTRSFHLGIETLTPETDFDCELDWTKDVLKFSFKLHPGYQGGRPELLHRIQRLFQDDNLLGITQKYLGREAMAEVLTEMRKSHRKKNNWRAAVIRYDCSTSWLRRSEAASIAYYKLVVDKYETAMFAVDTNNEEYKAVVGSKAEKFLQMLTIPARVWMKILSLSESYDKVKQQKAEIAVLFTAAQEKTKSSDDSSGEEAGENEFQKLVRYLESEADERIAPGSAAAQQICEHPNDKLDASHEGGSDCGSIMHSASASANEVSIGIDQEEELKGMDSGVMDNQPEEQRPIGSKKTLKKRIQRRRKKEQLKLQEERLREETQNLATASESTDLSAVTRSEPVALNQQPSDTSPTELTDCASFTTAPLSPSSSPQRSGSFQSLEYHTPPPSTDSSSRPLQPAQPSHEIVAAFVRKVQETRLPEPAADMESVSALRERDTNEPVHQAQDISLTKEIITLGIPTSSDVQSQSPAIEKHTTSPEKEEIMTRSERESPDPAPNLSSALRGSAAVFIPSGVVSTGQQDDDYSDRSDSEATIRASTEPASKMSGKKKSQRKKHTRLNTRKRLAADKGLFETQQPVIQDDETRQNDVEAQDLAVTNASSQRDSASTHDQPSPSALATSAPKKAAKQDKDKARVSDITMLDAAVSLLGMSQSSTGTDTQSCPEDASPGDEGRATPRASPVYRRPSPDLEWPQADADFWAPVQPATDPDMGEPSKMAAIRAMTPSSSAVVPAEPSFRGASSYITPAKTPSSKVVVPAGSKQGDASSPRTTQAMTPGLSTVVPAGSEGDDFVQGAYPAMTPGPQIVVPAGPSQGGLPATPASIDDRSAHPSRAQAQGLTTDARPSSGTGTEVQKKPTGFFYDLIYHSFECQMDGCERRCMLWDGSSVVCPACGPYSVGIYCSKEHMREDVKSHWSICGQLTFAYPCKKLSVPPNILVGPPQIPSVHNWSSPEHHRQAMYFCTARREGDYFIFSDYSVQMSSTVPLGHPIWRCLPHVLFTVKFTDEAEKDRFRRILAACLLLALEVQPLVDYLFRLIRDWFRSQDQWSEWMDGMLRYQFKYELGVWLPPAITGERHACECEWSGRNRRFCRDQTCASERHALLGDWGWARGYQRLCDSLEANHWLLRAHRTTHPAVRDVEARTRGDGFDEVLPEDRRLFRRGEGWDGFDSGPMEIEESLAGVEYCRPYPL